MLLLIASINIAIIAIYPLFLLSHQVVLVWLVAYLLLLGLLAKQEYHKFLWKTLEDFTGNEWVFKIFLFALI